MTTVLNENGMRSLGLYEYYDLARRIGNVQATILNAAGEKQKVYKKKDFRDRSLGDGFSIFNDNRILQLDYTPTAYPFTVIFETEVETSNTAFLPSWRPVSSYYASTEEIGVEIICPAEFNLQAKEVNFSDRFVLEKKQSGTHLSYSGKNLPAVKMEDYSPSLSRIVPMVHFRVSQFNLEGVDGTAADWKEFGKWYFDNLIKGTEKLSPQTIAQVKTLVGAETDPEKIARLIYQFVQGKTRYVSVQVGIGGFKPMTASSVDAVGYGDCKGLTNYTRALLEVAGVPSYFTLVQAGRTREDFIPDFASAAQGNHAILAIPKGKEYIWLECTSQTDPFGFQGTFTDDRGVLVIRPDGGEVVKTSGNFVDRNFQLTNGTFSLLADGSFAGEISMDCGGSQYSDRYGNERLSAHEKEKYYKDYFSFIENLKVDEVKFRNDPDAIRFNQNLKFSTPTYATLSGDRLMFAPNACNRYTSSPKRYRKRENPFEISRGYYDKDELQIKIPEGFAVEALPDDVKIENKFGSYEASVKKNADGSLKYVRILKMLDGYYVSGDYEAYRLFREDINRHDNAKIILIKKT